MQVTKATGKPAPRNRTRPTLPTTKRHPPLSTDRHRKPRKKRPQLLCRGRF